MTSTTWYLVGRLLIDCAVVFMFALLLYIIVYQFRKYILEKWIVKAVNAAESIFTNPTRPKEYSETKKTWVIQFLKDNNLTQGVSDSVVDTLIEAEVNTMNIEKFSKYSEQLAKMKDPEE